ncbi:hypothetical protein F5Y15DRAFT_92712 [Xylariaceae sp. FL0016]|nr:hypothetical protein F5Y15DRAFT_92712 [Xylariaceae sp. FL0016]
MADRAPYRPTHRVPRGAHLQSQSQSQAQSQPQPQTYGPNPPNVRRNLFQSQLTRRPTPTSSNSAETLRLGDNNACAAPAAHASSHSNSGSQRSDSVEVLSETATNDTSDIVIRDQNGEFEVGDPPTPPLDDPDEVAAVDEAQESERERRRLADAVRQHYNHTRRPAHPEEVLEALRASMRAKVAALAEDNWMYEPEEEPRPQ